MHLTQGQFSFLPDLTDAERSGFQMMTEFLDLMLDPLAEDEGAALEVDAVDRALVISIAPAGDEHLAEARHDGSCPSTE